MLFQPKFSVPQPNLDQITAKTKIQYQKNQISVEIENPPTWRENKGNRIVIGAEQIDRYQKY